VQVKVVAVARVVGAKAADVAKVTVVDGQARREAHREEEGPTRRVAASNSPKTKRLDWKRFSRFFLEMVAFPSHVAATGFSLRTPSTQFFFGSVASRK
jgi:hypothetical protein